MEDNQKINGEAKENELEKIKIFLDDILGNGQLSPEYFEITYSKTIQPEMYKILDRKIKYINKLLAASNNNKKGLASIKNFENIFGFQFQLEENNVFYCLDSNGLEEIDRDYNSNEKFERYINSLHLPLELISFSSEYSSSMSAELDENIKRERKDQIKKGLIKYEFGKQYELISLERLNYSTNLEENFTQLTQLPNIIFYLIPFKKMQEVKTILKELKDTNCENKEIITDVKNNLQYNSLYFGYIELVGIIKNDVNLKRRIKEFDCFKKKKIYSIKNKQINEISNAEDYILPYSLNYIEIKRSFNYLKEKKQVLNFLEKCNKFIKLFEKLQLNILQKPTIFDNNENNKDFPRYLSNDFFFIVNSTEDVISKYQDEIKNQINEFINLHEDIDFNIHFYYSKGFFESSEIKYIHSSKMINDLAISSQINQKFYKIQDNFNKVYKIMTIMGVIIIIMILYEIYKMIPKDVKEQDL